MNDRQWAIAQFQEWADEDSHAKHQPRERAVPCADCHKDTWNAGGVCPDCMGHRVITKVPAR